jgi:hypothetical protein
MIPGSARACTEKQAAEWVSGRGERAAVEDMAGNHLRGGEQANSTDPILLQDRVANSPDQRRHLKRFQHDGRIYAALAEASIAVTFTEAQHILG